MLFILWAKIKRLQKPSVQNLTVQIRNTTSHGVQECFILCTKGNMFFINCINSLLWFKIPNNEGSCSWVGIWKALYGLMTRLSLSVNNSILIEHLWQCKITLKINPFILGKSNNEIHWDIFLQRYFPSSEANAATSNWTNSRLKLAKLQINDSFIF